jgi:hypothetical protein
MKSLPSPVPQGHPPSPSIPQAAHAHDFTCVPADQTAKEAGAFSVPFPMKNSARLRLFFGFITRPVKPTLPTNVTNP